MVAPEFGVSSQVWIRRQCDAFAAFTPVLLSWREHAPGACADWPHEQLQFSSPLAPPRTLLRRAGRRLGFSDAVLPTRAMRADIEATLRRARVDAVLCHFAWSGVPVSASVADRWPLLWHVHGGDVSRSLRQRAFRNAVRRLLPGVGHVVAVGRHQIDRLRPLGLTPAHSVVPCGAPTAMFAARPVPERAPGAPLRFVAVSRISDEKGVFETLAAFELVAARHPAAHLTMIGDGPEAQRLRLAIAASAARDRITYLGFQPPPLVAEALSSAHVFVQHSRETPDGWVEGFGVTLTEAGAAGLPLVAARTGGVLDQVECGANGLLFEQGSVEGQARAMTRLLEDERLRRRMGAEARRRAEALDAGAMTARLEEVIIETIHRHRAAHGAAYGAAA